VGEHPAARAAHLDPGRSHPRRAAAQPEEHEARHPDPRRQRPISRITGKAAEQGPEKYQSARIDLVWLDEEHPEAVWDELQPRLLRWRGRSIASMTPLKGLTWVHGRIYEPIQTGRIPPQRTLVLARRRLVESRHHAEAIAELTEELKNNPSQLSARLDGFFVRPFGTVYDFDLTRDGVDLEAEALRPSSQRRGTTAVSIWGSGASPSCGSAWIRTAWRSSSRSTSARTRAPTSARRRSTRCCRSTTCRSRSSSAPTAQIRTASRS
jgi:phage terminase large subunit-like protein